MMKRGMLAVCLAILVGAGCGIVAAQWMMAQAAEPAVAEAEPEDALTEQVEEIVAAMTPEEKIGQMMMAGLVGTELDEAVQELLTERHIGGIVLYDVNMRSTAQVRMLTADLQAMVDGPVPLFIAVDEEGGRVVRMRKGITPPPAQAEVAATGKPEEATRWALATGQALKAIGINVNFAPVADLGPEKRGRAYSADPAVCAQFLRAAAAGYEQAGELYTLKHFPGLGKSRVDTHVDTDQVTASHAVLAAEDFTPFRAVMASQPSENFLVMVSHLHYAALDEKYPASLSHAVITDVLRGELGWKGLVITDDLGMGAVRKYYDDAEAGVQAVLAGADIVLIAHGYEHQAAMYDGLLQAYEDGRLSEERIDESVRRIVRVKLAHLQ